MPPEFIAGPWGTVGQYLVPGASNTLLHNISCFPEADSTRLWLTLIGWVLLGVLLTYVGHILHRRRRIREGATGTEAADAQRAQEEVDRESAFGRTSQDEQLSAGEHGTGHTHGRHAKGRRFGRKGRTA